MEFSVNRFKQYLLNRQNEIYEMLLKLKENDYSKYLDTLSASEVEINTISNFLRIFSVERDKWCNYKELFGDFDILSLYLMKAQLNDSDKTNIVFYLIKKNIATGILDGNCRLVDSAKIKEYQFDEYTDDEVSELFSKVGFENLDKKSRYEYLDGITISNYQIQDLHRIINRHYFEKYNNLEDKDIDQILFALSQLAVDERIIKSIERNLIKQKDKQELKKQSSKLNFFSSEKVDSVKEDKKLSNKEYKIILKELRNYIDFETHKPCKMLNLEEIIYVVSLLIKISINDEDIAKFCNQIEKENKKKMHPLALYADLYRKINYYKDNGYDFDLSEINSYINELFIVDDSDYVFWLEQVKDEVSKIYSVFPKDYQFEIEEGKKLLKDKK